jgi:hypothetical protein
VRSADKRWLTLATAAIGMQVIRRRGAAKDKPVGKVVGIGEEYRPGGSILVRWEGGNETWENPSLLRAYRG